MRAREHPTRKPEEIPAALRRRATVGGDEAERCEPVDLSPRLWAVAASGPHALCRALSALSAGGRERAVLGLQRRVGNARLQWSLAEAPRVQAQEEPDPFFRRYREQLQQEERERAAAEGRPSRDFQTLLAEEGARGGWDSLRAAFLDPVVEPALREEAFRLWLRRGTRGRR